MAYSLDWIPLTLLTDHILASLLVPANHTPQAAKALAEQKRRQSDVQRDDAARRAIEAEQSLAEAVTQGDALREEVERLRVADIGEMEVAWA